MSSAHSIEVRNIRVGVTHLRHGGLLIYPTETAYAIGCDATDARAVRAIFRLKGRERDKPLPLIVASLTMAERYARFTPLARQLAQRHWPGPLTIVAASAKLQVPTLRSGPRYKVVGATSQPTSTFSPPPTGRGSARGWGQLAPGVVARDGTIAIRVSPHPIARALSRRLGRPIVSTSANRSGSPPCYSVRAAFRSLQLPAPRLPSDDIRAMRPHPKYVIRRSVCRRIGRRRGRLVCIAVFDVGALLRRKPSMVVDGTGDHPRVLRKGAAAPSTLGSSSVESVQRVPSVV